MSPRTGWTPGSLDVDPLRPVTPHIAGCNTLGLNQHFPGQVGWQRGATTTETILGQVGGTQKVCVRNFRDRQQNNVFKGGMATTLLVLTSLTINLSKATCQALHTLFYYFDLIF